MTIPNIMKKLMKGERRGPAEDFFLHTYRKFPVRTRGYYRLRTTKSRCHPQKTESFFTVI
jgi:hypothetical protein